MKCYRTLSLSESPSDAEISSAFEEKRKRAIGQLEKAAYLAAQAAMELRSALPFSPIPSICAALVPLINGEIANMRLGQSKCPTCVGTGIMPMGNGTTDYHECHVCKGRGRA